MFSLLNNLEERIIVAIQKILSNPFLDWFFPFYTDIHKESWFILSLTIPLISLWVYYVSLPGELNSKREVRTSGFEGKTPEKKTYSVILGFFLTLIVTDIFCGQIIKKTFERARPFQASVSVMALSPASGFSFVSNHAANSFAIATYLSHFYPKYAVIFWSMAALTAFSRVYNGVHYPSDVVVGGLIGFIVSKLIIRFIMKIQVVLDDTRHEQL
jgi:undecaprenyl-diphosphatase